jgi:hypothetical protein
VPLFAVETVRSLIDRDLVVPRGGEYVLADGVSLDAASMVAPASLHALVAARLDTLSAEQRVVVDRASVLGMTFTPEALTGICPELSSLDEDDLYRILTEPRNALTRQYEALLATEGVELAFTDESLREMARLASLVNGRTEDIGARRLQTIFEKVLEEISFSASDRPGEKIVVEDAFVTERVGEIAVDDDLSNFIL